MFEKNSDIRLNEPLRPGEEWEFLLCSIQVFGWLTWLIRFTLCTALPDKFQLFFENSSDLFHTIVLNVLFNSERNGLGSFWFSQSGHRDIGSGSFLGRWPKFRGSTSWLNISAPWWENKNLPRPFHSELKSTFRTILWNRSVKFSKKLKFVRQSCTQRESNQSSQSTEDLYGAQQKFPFFSRPNRLIQPYVTIFLKHIWGSTLEKNTVRSNRILTIPYLPLWVWVESLEKRNSYCMSGIGSQNTLSGVRCQSLYSK